MFTFLGLFMLFVDLVMLVSLGLFLVAYFIKEAIDKYVLPKVEKFMKQFNVRYWVKGRREI